MKLVDAEQLSVILGGVSSFSVRRWARQGRIPSIAVGRLRRFDPEQVLRHLKKGTRTAQNQRRGGCRASE